MQAYYDLYVRKDILNNPMTDLIRRKFPKSATGQEIVAFDDGSVVVVTESDLDGYDPSLVSTMEGGIWADLSVVYRVRVAGQAALARISCLWLRCDANQKVCCDKLNKKTSCTVTTDHLGGISVDIHVY